MPTIGQGIIIDGDGYPLLSSYVTPFMSPPGGTILAAYFLGGLSKKGTLYNYADPSKPLKKVGEPLVFSNYSRCDVSNHYDTQQAFPDNAVRVIAITRPQPEGTSITDRGIVLSDYNANGSNNAEKGLFLDVYREGGQVVSDWLWPSAVTGKVTKKVTEPNPADFQMASGGHFPAQLCNTSLYNFDTETNDGGSDSATAVNAYTPSGRTLLLGGHWGGTNGSFQGPVDIAGVMIVSWGTDLTAAMKWLHRTQGPQLKMWTE